MKRSKVLSQKVSSWGMEGAQGSNRRVSHTDVLKKKHEFEETARNRCPFLILRARFTHEVALFATERKSEM